MTDASAYAGVTLPVPMTLGDEADAETVLVTGIAGNTLTVTRGWQGTAKIWPDGAVIALETSRLMTLMRWLGM